MNNFFCNHKTQKSDPEHTFSEIDINYRRDYSKGKSFKVSIWNEIDTYNNDDFIQDFVIYNQSLWARIDSTPSTNEVPTEGPWTKVMDGVSDVQFKEEGNKIFWKYEDESEWKDLFELDVVSESEIKNMLKDIATDVNSNFYDKTLSETSVNAVQNKVITQALNKKADKTELSKKQDVISDLSEIRNKANSALQSVPSEYVTESELANKGYLTEHQDISGKQDKIADLAQIRTNAQKGATALQTVPSEYATKTDVSNEVAKIVNSAPKAFDTLKEIADWIEEDAEPAIVLANKVEQKVDKVEGLGLSEENYTNEEKEKLAGLENYDDTKLKEEIAETYATKEYVDEAVANAEGGGEGGSSYDDTELREAIEDLDTRVAAHSEEIANLQENKADKSELTELSAEVSGLSEGIALRNVGAEDTDESVDEPSIPSNGMTTPSGDPMHYMYEAVGAEWNGTGADIERQGVYGDTITHKAGYWYLNELGDITTEEMRTIYAYSFPMQRRMNLETAFAMTPIRTNIAVWDADRTSTFGSIAHSQADLRGVCADAADMEIFAFIKGSQSSNIQKHIAHLGNSFSRAFYDATKLRKIIGYLNVSSSTDYQTFMYAEMLEEVRMWKLSNDFSFAYCSKLSKASLLFAITNSAATKAITITLHADAYARLAEDADIVAALAEKTNVSLAK